MDLASAVATGDNWRVLVGRLSFLWYRHRMDSKLDENNVSIIFDERG